MFDSLPSVGHASAGNFTNASITEFALHRPRMFIPVEVAVDKLRQVKFECEAYLGFECFATIAEPLVASSDTDASACDVE